MRGWEKAEREERLKEEGKREREREREEREIERRVDTNNENKEIGINYR